MKLTKTKLQQLIQEELKIIREMQYYDPAEESPEQEQKRDISSAIADYQEEGLSREEAITQVIKDYQDRYDGEGEWVNYITGIAEEELY